MVVPSSKRAKVTHDNASLLSLLPASEQQFTPTSLRTPLSPHSVAPSFMAARNLPKVIILPMLPAATLSYFTIETTARVSWSSASPLGTITSTMHLVVL